MKSLAYTHSIRWMAMLAALSTAGGACSQETGLVIEISQGTVSERPNQLDIYVALDSGDHLAVAGVPGCGPAESYHRYIAYADAEERRVSVGGRDLTTDPYRLLLRPDADFGLDDSLMVAVVARQNERTLGIGALSDAVRFVDGKVLQWNLSLEPNSDITAAADTECLCTTTDSDGDVLLATDNDRDCDGDPADIDCNDENPDQSSGARERCDGYNTDCDPNDERMPSKLPCLQPGGQTCFLGERLCDDYTEDPSTAVGACDAGDQDLQLPPPVCQAFDECAGSEDPIECVFGEDPVKQYSCVAKFALEGILCQQHSVRLQDMSDSGQNCQWILIGGSEQTVFQAVLFDGIGNEGAVVNACDPVLSVFRTHEPNLVENDRFYLVELAGGLPVGILRLDVTSRQLQLCENQADDFGFACAGLDSVPDPG